ncbi:MAG: hypothetical protein ACKOAR_00715, partial [Bacteroidota bacterium]
GGSRPTLRKLGIFGITGKNPIKAGGEAFSWQPQMRFNGNPGNRMMVGSTGFGKGVAGGIGYRNKLGIAVPTNGKGRLRPFGSSSRLGGEAFSWQPQMRFNGNPGAKYMVGSLGKAKRLQGSGGIGWRPWGMAVPPIAKGYRKSGRATGNLNPGYRAPTGGRTSLNWRKIYGQGRKADLSFPRASGGNLPLRRPAPYLGLDAFRLSGARPGSPGAGVRVPVGGVQRIESNYNSLRAIGYKGFPGAFGFSDLNVRMRRPQARMDAGIGTARSIIVRRKPLNDLQKPTSRNPGGRPAIGSGLTIKRRPALLSMDNRRLQTHPSRAALSAAVAQGRMTRVRPNPYMDDVMLGATYSGFKKYKKHHYVNLHTPSWVKLLRGDFRNSLRVLHPSDRANQELGSYAGNIRRNPFRNRYIDADIAGAGKMYFRVFPNHPFEVTGYPLTIKQQRYVHAPMSSKDALMVKAPDKAYIRTAMMQANVKMSKVHHADLATDAAFFRRQEAMEHGKKGEKRSIRKMFASLIGKSTLIPPGLKAKLINPGYDPREKGLWAK